MINAILVIFICQFLGEWIVHITQIEIPSSVIGMLILLIGLMIKGDLPQGLDNIATTFFKYIGLLFVPLGAGISVFLHLIAEHWLIIFIASFGSTALTLVLTAYCFQRLSKADN